MHRLALLLLVASCVALAGCFGPRLGDRPFVCGEAPDPCPPDYTCDGTYCVKTPGGVDGGGGVKPDAPLAGPDARRPADARPGAPDARATAPDAAVCQGNDFDQCLDDHTALLCDGSELDCAFACSDAAHLCEQCDPAKPSFCQGSDAIATCTAAGQLGPSTQSCPGFCTSQGGATRCATLVPSILPSTTCDQPASVPRTITAQIPFNTDVCPGGQLVGQVGGPSICVLRYTDLTITTSGGLVVTGVAALALVATHDLELDGAVDVSAAGTTSGPGAPPSAPGRGVTDVALATSGGGGGGYEQPGGTGGSEVLGVSIAGGVSYGNASLVPLIGGSPGGNSGMPEPCVGSGPAQALGGGGGGALQLVACHALHLGLLGSIYADGAGGGGGKPSMTCPGSGGAGGGSGGAVLLEAPAIDIGEFGGVLAVGGGGGGGGATGDTFGVGGNGVDGKLGGAGGAGGDMFCGPGGYAAYTFMLSPTPGPGGDAQLPAYGAGGGGGAEGRIRINSRADAPFDPGNADIDPPPALGAVGSH